MAIWSLDLIGVPIQYRNRNPYALTPDEQLDAFPKNANPDYVNTWLELLQTGAHTASSISRRAWQEAVYEFVAALQTLGKEAFITDPFARNVNEHVINFLQIRRRRLVKWVDSTNLLKRTIYDSGHHYIRKSNSFVVRAHVHFRPIRDGIKIGESLQNRKFFRASVPFVKGNVWSRWLEFGVIRVVWAATTANDATLFYEIHCPYTPELPIVDDHNLGNKEFTNTVDSNIWLPLVHKLRWMSSSNPRIWRF